MSHAKFGAEGPPRLPDAAKDKRVEPARLRVLPPDTPPSPKPGAGIEFHTAIQPPPESGSEWQVARDLTRDSRIDSTRDRAKSDANRHSRFVRFAKISLPIIGLLVAGVFVGRTWLFSQFPGLNMPAVLFSKNGLTMVEPRLTGRSRDRAYDIGANRATQDFMTPKVVQLEQLAGRVEMQDNGWAKIESHAGTYDGNKNTLNLAGGVTVTTSTGYLLTGEAAAIDLTKGNMSTDKPVHIHGPTGMLEAGSADVTDSGANIRFTGRVHMTINPAFVPDAAGSTQKPGNGTAE
jgi:lipopolysaccharide export system protein LptC